MQERLGALPGAGLGGYMPLRGDFDVEHENGAELVRRRSGEKEEEQKGAWRFRGF